MKYVLFIVCALLLLIPLVVPGCDSTGGKRDGEAGKGGAVLDGNGGKGRDTVRPSVDLAQPARTETATFALG